MNVGDKVIAPGGTEYEVRGKTEGGQIIVDKIRFGILMGTHLLFREDELRLKKEIV